jgi:hypothetical protein
MRDGLYVAPSSVHGKGLFASQRILRGGFVGFYTGNPMCTHEYNRHSRARTALATNAMQNGRFVMIPDPSRDTLMFVNEPPPGSIANCTMAILVRDAYRAVAYYATRDIRAHEELYIHYGVKYHRRPYRIGRPGEALREHELETPRGRPPKRAFVPQ